VIDFLKETFGAADLRRLYGPDGNILDADCVVTFQGDSGQGNSGRDPSLRLRAQVRPE
jgi:hypothetical protein